MTYSRYTHSCKLVKHGLSRLTLCERYWKQGMMEFDQGRNISNAPFSSSRFSLHALSYLWFCKHHLQLTKSCIDQPNGQLGYCANPCFSSDCLHMELEVYLYPSCTMQYTHTVHTLNVTIYSCVPIMLILLQKVLWRLWSLLSRSHHAPLALAFWSALTEVGHWPQPPFPIPLRHKAQGQGSCLSHHTDKQQEPRGQNRTGAEAGWRPPLHWKPDNFKVPLPCIVMRMTQ